MRKPIILATIAAQLGSIPAAAGAAELTIEPRRAETRTAAFAGARLQVALDGPRARVRAGLTVAPALYGIGDGAPRQESVLVDGNPVAGPVNLADGRPQRLAVRLDPAFYADRSIQVAVESPGIDGTVVAEVALHDVDYRYADSGAATAEVVYVGYGISAPELNYDDYAGVDVKGKFVAFEPEVPVGPEPNAEAFKKWRPSSFHDYKMKNAAAHGAIGIVYNYFIVNPNAVFIKGLQWAAVSRVVMEDLFAGTGKKHPDVVAQIRKTLTPASMAERRVTPSS